MTTTEPAVSPEPFDETVIGIVTSDRYEARLVLAGDRDGDDVWRYVTITAPEYGVDIVIEAPATLDELARVATLSADLLRAVSGVTVPTPETPANDAGVEQP